MKYLGIVVIIIALVVIVYLTREPVLQNGFSSNSVVNSEQAQQFTHQEVLTHNTSSDCWTIIAGNVYDVTGYVNTHPGGQTILAACGVDATVMFEQRPQDGQPHTKFADTVLDRYFIGSLAQ